MRGQARSGRGRGELGGSGRRLPCRPWLSCPPRRTPARSGRDHVALPLGPDRRAPGDQHSSRRPAPRAARGRSLHAVTIDGAAGRIAANALFVFIGADPCTGWLSGALSTEEDGILLTGQDLQLTHLDPTRAGRDRLPLPLETSRPGVFACGSRVQKAKTHSATRRLQPPVRATAGTRVVFGSSCALNRCCEATSRHLGQRCRRRPSPFRLPFGDDPMGCKLVPKASKSRSYAQSSDGETRTRTGDTTNLQSCGGNSRTMPECLENPRSLPPFSSGGKSAACGLLP